MEGLIEDLENRAAYFLTKSETADIFRCSPFTIARWIEEGRLKAWKPKQKHLICKSSVVELLKENKCT